MTKLTETQSTLLCAAALAGDGAIDAPDDAKPVRLLIKQGLFIAVPQTDSPTRLIITDAGREAVDAPRASTAEAVEPGAPPASDPEPAPVDTSARKQTKIQAVVALLRRPEGARVEDIMAATGWQAHSVRGAMSGSIKKGLGLTIASHKVNGVRVYRAFEAQA